VREPESATRIVGLPRAVLAGCFTLMVTMGLLAASYGPLLPVIRDQFSVSPVATGLLVSALPAGATVAILVSAALQRRVPTRFLLQGSCAFLVAGLVGLALAPTWPLLLTSGTAIGLGYGGATSLANGVIAAAYPSRRATFLLNLQNGIFGLGAVLGPVCVALLPEGSGRLAWLWYAVLAAAAAGLFAALPLTSLASPERAVPAHPDTDPDALLAKNVPSDGQRSGHLAKNVPSARAGGGRLGWFALLFACLIAAEISAGAWAPTHLEALGQEVRTAAFATSLFYLGLASGRMGAALIGLRVDPGPLLVASTILATAMLTLTYFAPLGGFAYVLAGAAIGPVFPTGLAWVSTDQPQARHAMATVLVAGNLGGITLPPVVGAVIGTVGAQAAPLPIAATAALGAVVAVLLARGARRPGLGRAD